jgi:hypothetical protein
VYNPVGEGRMYRFSRSIYRELAPYVVEDRLDHAGPSNHELVLWACEAAVERLAGDRHYFARPARTLFRDIRIYFPLAEQWRVHAVVDRYMTFARDYLAEHPLHQYDANGNRIGCRAMTRRGTPCQRPPLPRNGYCPSHQHLAADVELAA